MTEYLRREEQRRLIQAEKVARRVSITIMFIVTPACFAGLREILGESLVLLCSILATGGGLILSAMWGILFKSVPISLHKDKQAQMVGLAALLVVAGMAFSAWPTATIIGGNSAITEYLSESESQDQNTLLVAKAQLENQASLIDNVEQESADLEMQAQSEITSGAIGNGLNGQGPIALALGATANQLHDIAAQQQTLLDNAKASADAAQGFLDNMQHIIADQSSGTIERQEKFSSNAAKLSVALNVIESTDLMAPLNSFNPAATAYNPPTLAGQQALRQIEQGVNQFVDNLRNRAKQTLDGDAPQSQPFAPISTGNAVILFAQNVVGAWAIACGLDCLPFLLLLMLINIYRSYIERYQTPDPWDRPDVSLYPGPPSPGGGSHKPSPDGGGEIIEFEVERKKAAGD